MKTKLHYLSALTTAALLAPLASAQVAGPVGNAAQTAANHSNAAANAQHAASASSRAANASASAAASKGAQISAAHSPAVTGATSTAAAATTAAGASIPATKGTLNARVASSTEASVPRHPHDRVKGSAAADVKVHGTARAPGLSAEGNPGGNISASLNSQAAAARIRNATRESREEVFAGIETSVEASKRSLAQLRLEGREVRKEARAQFKAANEEVRAREKALRASLKDARRAAPDKAAAAQARLAADYEGYATAVAMTESTVNGSISTQVPVK